MLFNGEGEAFNVWQSPDKKKRMKFRLTAVQLGRRIPRVDITIRLGRLGNRPLHGSFSCRSGMVSRARGSTESQEH